MQDNSHWVKFREALKRSMFLQQKEKHCSQEHKVIFRNMNWKIYIIINQQMSVGACTVRSSSELNKFEQASRFVHQMSLAGEYWWSLYRGRVLYRGGPWTVRTNASLATVTWDPPSNCGQNVWLTGKHDWKHYLSAIWLLGSKIKVVLCQAISVNSGNGCHSNWRLTHIYGCPVFISYLQCHLSLIPKLF